MPLVFHLVLNTVLAVRTQAERIAMEPVRRAESTALQPHLDASRKRVLSVHLDPLIHNRRTIEVEPLIYTLLSDAGLSDPEPVRRDLAAGRFDTVVLYENLFAENAFQKNAETPSLPGGHLEEIRRNYRLVRHIDGPYLAGVYVYEPRRY